MSARIDSVYYFDYTREIGFYDSIRNFTAVEMEYIGMAISTERVRVNSTPTINRIDQTGSEMIREYVISHLGSLVEISKELAINSPRYILIAYADDSEKYFKFDEDMLCIFKIATSNKKDAGFDEEKNESPYAIQKNDEIKPQQSQSESPYAIQKDNTNAKQNYTSSATYNYTQSNRLKNKKEDFPWTVVVIPLIFIGAFLGLCIWGSSGNTDTNTPSYNESTLTPVSEPYSGQILSGREVYGESELTITASSSESCVVKLKTSSGTTRMSFYVRAGETVTVGVPCEYLYIYFASGDTWYGTSYLFGDETSYSMDDEIMNFEEYTWEYTLYPVSNGNFTETPIDASDF